MRKLTLAFLFASGFAVAAPPGGHILIEEVKVDGAEIFITGSDFDFGSNLVVRLGMTDITDYCVG